MILSSYLLSIFAPLKKCTMHSATSLENIETGKSCVIIKVNGHGGFRHRIMELGFVNGQKIEVLKNAPLEDPIEYKILNSHISLRRSEARQIEVVPVSNDFNPTFQYNGMLPEDNDTVRQITEKTKTITVALVGNPNCGKTSFFNIATGAREKVGNYSGVTVDAKTSTLQHNGYTITLVDLPGTYSITEFSPEELYVRDYITKQHPDVVLNIVDASNLERNLFLTTQLIDMNVKMVMALNMYDELEKRGDRLDYDSLSTMFGFPIVPTTASKGLGINELLDNIIEMYKDSEGFSKHIHINYGIDIENAIARIKRKIVANKDVTNLYPARYIAIKLLDNDAAMKQELSTFEHFSAIEKVAAACRREIEKSYREAAESVITKAKYGFVRGALAETFTPNSDKRKERQYSIDALLTNKWLGFPLLFLFLWVMFQATFTLGAYPQEWLETGIEMFGTWVQKLLPEGIFSDLLVDGIIAGVGGVLVFLPNILILYFFMSILEDTGYMARAAFLTDKLMHRIGLHGKSFIPFLLGFGCSVPAIMATRTLENPKDRIITILAIPFMSCSARLPIYILFISAFFAKHQGIILLSVYLIGIIVAMLTALLLKKSVFKGASDQFVMELPPYRIPTLRNISTHMWDKSMLYLKKMGSVILIASVIIWALGYFPRNNEKMQIVQQKMQETEQNVQLSQVERDSLLALLEVEQLAAHNEGSIIGQIGHFIEPAMQPLGLDWRAGVGLVSGIAAKEIIVSTMSVLYHSDNQAVSHSEKRINGIKSSVHTSGELKGQPIFTPLVGYVFMIFVLLYVPCIATIIAIQREAGTKWMWFSSVYTTTLAWLISFLVYQIGNFF